jgi:hypothetical protein
VYKIAICGPCNKLTCHLGLSPNARLRILLAQFTLAVRMSVITRPGLYISERAGRI